METKAVTYDGETVVLINEDDEPDDNYCGYHKGYEITVTLSRMASKWKNERTFEVWCYRPDGTAIIKGQSAGTIEDGIQMCLTAIGGDK